MGLSAAARRVGDGKVGPWAGKYGFLMDDRQVLT
jgi:hypothetical protein